jgi:hypothetical protein
MLRAFGAIMSPQYLLELTVSVSNARQEHGYRAATSDESRVFLIFDLPTAPARSRLAAPFQG